MLLFCTLPGILLACLVVGSRAQKLLDNAIIGTPEIECGETMIMARIQTKKPFHGKIFVKGMSARKECTIDLTHDRNASTSVLIPLKFNQCRTERSRTLSPSGVTYGNTVVVQFHKTFITKIDKAFSISCFYAESPRTVGYDFDVDHITPKPVNDQMAMPECMYTVRLNSPNGPVIKNAKVGDTVFHRWECRGNDAMYAMLVHTCFVENLQGDMFQIIDEQGCAVDNVLLPDLLYNHELTLAYRETQVFKYPDNAYVHFKCQIRLCTKMTAECRRITPPSCGGPKGTGKERSRRRVQFADSVRPASFSDLDVATEDIRIFDEQLELSQDESPYLSNESLSDPSPEGGKICANRILFTCLCIGFTIVLIGVFGFIVYILHRNHRRIEPKV